MPFYTMNELLALDPAKDWCIGHFNVHNYTTLGGVVKAAEEMKAPAILALGAQAYKHIGMENIMALCFSAMEQSNARFAPRPRPHPQGSASRRFFRDVRRLFPVL